MSDNKPKGGAQKLRGKKQPNRGWFTIID